MPDSRPPHIRKPFRLLTLGGAALVDGAGGPVAEQRRRLALLTLLASAGERGAFRDRLIACLSPESPAEPARHALHQLLYYLRQQAGEDAFLGTDPLRLNPEVISSDLADFDRAVEAGDLAGAAELYRGPFLDGFHLGDSTEFEDWASLERARLAARYRDTLFRLAEEADDRGDHPVALPWWRRLAHLDPMNGRAALGLMRSLAAAGDVRAALQHARAHEALLRTETGGRPDPEVAALSARLEAGGGRPAPVAVATTGTDISPDAGPISDAELPASPARPAKTHLTRRRLAVAGVTGALITLGIAAAVAWVSRPADADADLVAILPFRVAPADSGFAWLHDGMVELLAIRLTGEGGMRIAGPERLLSAWHRDPTVGETDVPESAVRRVAAELGAGRVIEGGVSGTPGRLLLTASIRAIGQRDVATTASAEGPLASLPQLVDRLAAQLLGQAAGVEEYRLASMTSASLPAIRAFLAGRSAFRQGRMEEAARRFRDAVLADSTFALAGLDLTRAAVWSDAGDADALGRRTARAGRSRLSDPDRALLDVTTDQYDNAPDLFAKWSRVVGRYPDRPETWYGLGDALYHWGALAGLEDHLDRAEEAFRRGWRLDSAFQRGGRTGMSSPLVAEPMLHMVELAHVRRDTAVVRQLVARVLEADSSSELARTLRWHLALIDGDSARRAYWSRMEDAGQRQLRNIVRFIAWTGMGVEDHDRAGVEQLRVLRAHDPGHPAIVEMDAAMNAGRPSAAPIVTDIPGFPPREGVRNRIRQALWWDGDTTVAGAAVRQLSDLADAPLLRGEDVIGQVQDICIIGFWRAAHGDLAAADRAARRLRLARPPEGLAGARLASFRQFVAFCPALLEAELASGLARPDTPVRIAVADTLARVFIFEICCGEAVPPANLILARLWEREGNPERALKAIRRRAGGYMIQPLYLTRFLREEGRLAALTGDTVAAIRAYRHYLGLRSDPEAAVQPRVEEVRRALARLTRGERRVGPASGANR
jgi:DNA-binding SARP family transcriptional activator